MSRGYSLSAADPRDVLDGEQLAFLDDIGAHLVWVVSEGASGDGRVVDLEGTYADWFEEAGVEAVVVRPDFYVYGTARTMGELSRLVSSLRSDLGYPDEHPLPDEAGVSTRQPPLYDATPEPGGQNADPEKR